MDISSGTVAFGITCPGPLLEKLLEEDMTNVMNIKTLQTSFARQMQTWQCHAVAKDIKIVPTFIKSIGALENLTVINFEKNFTILWPAIFQHGASLKSLAIHNPPMQRSDTWNHSKVGEVVTRLSNLERLEVDIALEDAIDILERANSDPQSTAKAPAQSIQDSSLTKKNPLKNSVLAQIPEIPNLSSLLVNINLVDYASVFAGQHTWNAMGSISYPAVNQDKCNALAQILYDSIRERNPNSRLAHLELRFARRRWDDRAQFWTLAHSIHVRKDDTAEGTRSITRGEWKEYLPPWSASGVLRQLSDQGFREAYMQR